MHSHQPPAAPEQTSRRTLLRWLTHGLGAAFTATLGVPVAMYLMDPRNRPARPGAFKAVARLSELKVGVPFEATIRETRRDAWTLHPDDVVGRVWLVRQQDDSVTALTTTCPHLGCSVNFERGKFVCPCHNGTFDVSGARVAPASGKSNPAPRDMDGLEVMLEADPANPKDKLILVKYKSFIQGKPEKIERT